MKKLLTFLIILVVIYGGWYFLSPLFINQSVDEALPTQNSEIPNQIEKVPSDVIMGEDVIMDEGMMPSPEPSVDVLGSFTGADNFHKASGNALVVTDIESQYLRFEDFSVTNGPELVVLLSTNENPAQSGELGEYVELAALKGNKGSQNYSLDDIDLTKYNSVVIYCKPFKTIFGSAGIEL